MTGARHCIARIACSRRMPFSPRSWTSSRIRSGGRLASVANPASTSVNAETWNSRPDSCARQVRVSWMPRGSESRMSTRSGEDIARDRFTASPCIGLASPSGEPGRGNAQACRTGRSIRVRGSTYMGAIDSKDRSSLGELRRLASTVDGLGEAVASLSQDLDWEPEADAGRSGPGLQDKLALLGEALSRPDVGIAPQLNPFAATGHGYPIADRALGLQSGEARSCLE